MNSHNLNAEIISIGTEILLGEITDTNSVFLARTLRDLGINLYFMTSVGDNEERIASAISMALSRADIVITCGGLGPTIDDVTRQAVARATDRGLAFHQNLLDQIAARFASFHVKMTDNNRRQAYLPDNAILIENPVGTAPGFIVEHQHGMVISLPGVPREMKFLMTEKVAPFLRERFRLGIIKARTLKTAGIGESMLDELIGPNILEHHNPTVGLAAHSGQIDVRITAKAETEEAADRLIASAEVQIRERAGKYIFGADDDALEQVLVNLLHSHSATLAVLEAGTGGGLIKLMDSTENGQQIIAFSQYYAHPDDLRQAYMMDPDMTLRELASRTAEQICKAQPTTAAVVIVSNPDIQEASDAVDGTAVAVYTPRGSRSRAYGFGAKVVDTRNWAITWGLSNLWQLLKDEVDTQ